MSMLQKEKEVHCVIYNEERPVCFDQMIGQELVVENIRNQAIRGQFFPVFILCGQYGSGKTTMARIIAMAANCKHKDEKGNPCGGCESCQAVLEHSSEGIIEIDGASNNGVDNVRKLLGQAATVGLFDKKIIVIDEAHMLSKSAFNALLITLENPPEHCIFILCTTEKEALPDTVVSRAAVYVFGKIADGLIKKHILAVAGKNGIGISGDAAGLLSRYANGAMRNALQLLEYLSMQKATGEAIEVADVITILGLSSLEQRAVFLDGCLSCDLNRVVGVLRSCEQKGIAIRTFVKDVLEMNTDLLLWKAGAEVVGTEFYMSKLKELAVYNEVALVTANKMLSAIASTPATSLSVERIAAEVISVMYLPQASLLQGYERKAVKADKKNPIEKPAISTSTENKVNLEGPSEEDIGAGDLTEGFVPVGDIPENPFEEVATEPKEGHERSKEPEPMTESEEISFGFDLFGGGLFGNMMEMPTGKKKKVKRESVDLLGQMAVAGASTPAKEVSESPEAEVDVAGDFVGKQPNFPLPEGTETSQENVEETVDDITPILKDSVPVETDGRISWDEAVAQGLVPAKSNIHLPVPESKEELDAYYAEEEKNREEAEETMEKGFSTRADLIEANNELQKLLKNPGFRILFNKARYVEENFHIYLCYDSQAMVTAAKMFLVGVKGITAKVDKEIK